MKKSDQIKAIGTIQVEESGQASGRHALWLAILAPLAALAMGLIAFSAFALSPSPPLSSPMLMNHCGVLRKITGFFDRQLWGY